MTSRADGRDGLQGRGAGFTLLELLVVLTILGLVVAVAPAMTGGDGARLRVAARDLAGDLRTLRSAAIRSRQVERLVLDRSHNGYRCGTGPVRPLPAGSELSFTPGMPPIVGDLPPEIAFYPDGSSTGGTVTLTRADVHYEVRIDWTSGRVTTDG